MRKTVLTLAATLALGVCASAANANTFLVQMDDLTDTLFVNTYEDGALIQSVGFPESYNGSYGLQWNAGAALASNVDIGVNILESDGTLSDTWRLFGSTGDTRINIPFFSDIEGQTLTPPLSATSIFETGNWQTVANFTLNNGDTFTWQFRSDVPEPAAWALMVVGFAGLGVALRSRRRNIAATA